MNEKRDLLVIFQAYFNYFYHYFLVSVLLFIAILQVHFFLHSFDILRHFVIYVKKLIKTIFWLFFRLGSTLQASSLFLAPPSNIPSSSPYVYLVSHLHLLPRDTKGHTHPTITDTTF